LSGEVMWSEHIGARSDPVRNTVEQGAVRHFAEAIGDLNPLYLDEEVAAESRWGRLIAPPTFPRVLDFGALAEIRMPPVGIIHGEQGYHYQRPLFVGEDLYCYTILEDVYERQGKAGKLIFVVMRRVAEDGGGDEVVSSREVYILTEAALAGAEEAS
jgi:acyl dehydratase